jgi:hypothetical protein
MPTNTGRAFTTGNFLPNLAALKAINFGASDPSGVWFVILNSTTGNVEIWVWDSASNLTTDEISVIRPDSVIPSSPGRCIQRLKFDATTLAGFLGSVAGLSTNGIIEKTGATASTNPIAAFGRTFLNLIDAAAGRLALALGNVATRNIGTASGTVRDAADTAYTNARTPTAHATTHAAGGADEIPIFGYLAISANTTLNATHERFLIDVNTTSAAITITLPAASTVGSGWQLWIRKNDASVNAVTINRAGSDTINGATSLQITTRYQTIVLLSFGGTSWGVVAAFDDWVRVTPDQSIGGVKTFTGGVILPSSAGSGAGSLWRNTDNLEYRDSTNTTRILLNNSGNLSNLSNRQTALNNLAGAVTANRVLRGNGTNVALDLVNLPSDVTGVLPIANGGTGSPTPIYVGLTGTESIAGAKTFTTSVRMGTANQGSVVLQTGLSANSGYIEIYRGDGITRNGFIGSNNVDLNYTSENGAVHTFNGGRVDVFGGTVPPTTSSRISQFLSGGFPYLSLISSSAGVGYKTYDISNENGAFSIRRIADGYTGVSGNLFRYTTANILTVGDASTRSSAAYGSFSASGSIAGYAGIHFPESFDGSVLMMGSTSRIHGVWSPNSSGGWQWNYNDGNFQILGGSGTSEGSFLGLFKGLNSLPGYPTSRYPTIGTDHSALYISLGGAYTGHFTSAGYTNVSNKDLKTVVEEIDPEIVLLGIERLPVTRFFFKEDDPRVTHIGTFAQDFWREFQCGGNKEIIGDDSPTSPDKMLAVNDVAGVCLAGIQGLIAQNRQLSKKVDILRSQLGKD